MAAPKFNLSEMQETYDRAWHTGFETAIVRAGANLYGRAKELEQAGHKDYAACYVLAWEMVCGLVEGDCSHDG